MELSLLAGAIDQVHGFELDRQEINAWVQPFFYRAFLEQQRRKRGHANWPNQFITN
jgi:hypothetical protein